MNSDTFPCFLTLTDCTFIGNRAGEDGGGMYNGWESEPMLTNCMFTANSAADSGGAVYNYWSGLRLMNCIFSGNLSSKGGGGMFSDDSWPRLINCTFSGNSASNGNALACDSYEHEDPSKLQLTNCILWDGGDEIWNNDESTIAITYSDVEGGWPGEGNIDADPCFVKQGYWAVGDDDYFWVEGDYHLLPDSPCIDAGDPNYPYEPNETDLDGKPRIIGGRIDMGAYESPIQAEVKILPRTINLASKGKWITAFLWLPEGYNVADIDPNSVILEDEIGVESIQVYEERRIALVRFSREELRAILSVGEVELAISGQLSDGTVFEAKDVIIVINKGSRKSAK